MPAIPPIETPTPAEPPTAVMCRIDLVASPSPIWLWDSNVHNTSQISGTRAVLVFSSTAVISLHKQNCSSGRGSGSVTSSPSHQWLMRWSNHRGPAMFFGAALESEEMKPFLSLNNDHPHHFTFHTNHLDFKTATKTLLICRIGYLVLDLIAKEMNTGIEMACFAGLIQILLCKSGPAM
ncbi:PREDICTED: uncharacterized protein LOC101313539 [Fragaria vesca subsp. vesca]